MDETVIGPVWAVGVGVIVFSIVVWALLIWLTNRE